MNFENTHTKKKDWRAWPGLFLSPYTTPVLRKAKCILTGTLHPSNKVLCLLQMKEIKTTLKSSEILPKNYCNLFLCSSLSLKALKTFLCHICQCISHLQYLLINI